MEETNAILAPDLSNGTKRLLLGATALVLILAAIFLYQVWGDRQVKAPPPGIQRLSEADLESRYGLRVRLIGVTAAGGMIDLRLKIVDAEKAKQFLEEPAHLPQLIDAGSGKSLMVSEGLDDDIEWKNGGILFNFYPNDNGLIEPGNPVIVQFGDLQLEPIAAQ